MTHKKMGKDGSYSDSIYGKAIDGTNESDERGYPRRDAGKARFLRDAAALMRQTAKILAENGLETGKVITNRAGTACSGEVSVEFWEKANPLLRVYVQIGTMPIASLSGREDGISILARVQTYRKEGNRWISGPSGHNQWLSPNMDSERLAAKVLVILEREPRAVQVHPAAEAPLVLPAPFVSSQAEAESLQAAYTRAATVLQAEAREKTPAVVPSRQMGLL